jgi:hypothetical protein
MEDTIDAVIADLEDAGRAGDVQWAGSVSSWDEGTIVCHRDGEAVVLTQLWRDESGDRVTRFASEAEAAADLRRYLLDTPIHHLTTEEHQAMMERTRRYAEETKARLRSEQEPS